MMLEAAQCCRIVFFTGLPASGKSFLLREQVSMAVSVGRRVQIIRWDSGLAAFSTEKILAKYPDIKDGSHPIIRLAAGLWGRQAVAHWLEQHSNPFHVSSFLSCTRHGHGGACSALCLTASFVRDSGVP